MHRTLSGPTGEQVMMNMEQDQWPPLHEQPPNILPALGTLLYPRNSDKLTPGTPAEEEMELISKSRQKHEHDTMIRRKEPRWKETRDKHGNTRSRKGKPYCSTCSEALSEAFPIQNIFHHNHLSSKAYRMDAVLDQYGQYLCYSCATTPHLCKSGTRYPVVITASALYAWHKQREKNGYKGDEIHVDVISIPGANLKVLQHALSAEFGGLNRPIDVLIVAGINDVLENIPLEEIVMRYMKIRAWVRGQNKYHPSTENTVAIATLPLIPKVVRLAGDDRPPLANDKYQLLCDLNTYIKTWNREEKDAKMKSHLATSQAPQFHTWGVETSHDPLYSALGSGHTAPMPVLQPILKHRWYCWRERKPDQKMHLANKYKFKMGRATVKYFMCLYGIIVSNHGSKKEAELAERVEEETRRARDEEDRLGEQQQTWGLAASRGGWRSLL